MYIFKTIIVPNFRSKDERYQSYPFPVAVVHKKPRFPQKPFNVYEAENWNFFFHSPADNNVLAVVVNFINCWLTHEFISNHFIFLKMVILMENSHLKLHDFLEILFIGGVELADSQDWLGEIIIFIVFFLTFLDVINNLIFNSTGSIRHHTLFLIVSAHETLQQMLTFIFGSLTFQKLIKVRLAVVHVNLVFSNWVNHQRWFFVFHLFLFHYILFIVTIFDVNIVSSFILNWAFTTLRRVFIIG